VGLVEQTVEGRRHVCRLVALPLAPAAAWLAFYERYWSDRLDALGELFRADPALHHPAPDDPTHHDPTLDEEDR